MAEEAEDGQNHHQLGDEAQRHLLDLGHGLKDAHGETDDEPRPEYGPGEDEDQERGLAPE